MNNSFRLRCESILVLGLVQQALLKMPFIQTISFITARQPILKLDLNPPYDGIRIDIGYNKIGVYNSHLLRYLSRFGCFIKFPRTVDRSQ